MKQLLPLLYLILPLAVQAQYAELINEVQFDYGHHYSWGFRFANENSLMVNQGYLGTYLLDKNLNIKASQKASCTAKGIGTGHLCGPNGLYIVRKRVCEHHHDSILIFDLANGKQWGEDLAQPIIDVKGLGKGGMPPFLNFHPYKLSNKVLVESHGDFWVYDIDKNELTHVSLDINKPKGWMPDPTCFIINDDKELLIYTAHAGLRTYNTKKWTEKATLEKEGRKVEDLRILADRKHYCYRIGNIIFVRNRENHKMAKQIELTQDVDDFDVASDLSMILFTNEEGVSLWTNETVTLLLKSKNYLSFNEIAIGPTSTHFFTGVMGNRVFKFKVHKTGKLPVNVKTAEVFSLTEQEAKELGTPQVMLELALRKMGYDIPLDNMDTRQDEKLYERFCKEHDLINIKSAKAQELLKLKAAE